MDDKVIRRKRKRRRENGGLGERLGEGGKVDKGHCESSLGEVIKSILYTFQR